MYGIQHMNPENGRLCGSPNTRIFLPKVGAILGNELRAPSMTLKPLQTYFRIFVRCLQNF